MSDPKIHLNVGGPRGWTTACGIESASFVDLHKTDEHEDVDCKRCLKAMESGNARHGRLEGPPILSLEEVLSAEIVGD